MEDRPKQLSTAERVDSLCDQYEHEFRAGNKPQIEALVSELDPQLRSPCLKGLLELDVELRKAAGQKIRKADYAMRFPNDQELINQVFDELTRAASQASSVKITGIESSQIPETRLAPQKAVRSGPLKTLGRFEIQSVLGEGAFGTVYRARDPQLDRDVALKVPKFQDQSNDDRERFLREARAAAGLHHAHICPVHEVGTIDGTDYIVLSFIDGKPLSKVLQSKPVLSDRQIVGVIRKLALALQEAHDKGIIHRDLKPANIMINRKGEPVIMDFGLARRSQSADAQISQSGQIMGTPAYMSPEQARGDSKSVGPASDIYSLGIVLYELMCGRRPFEGTVTEVIGQILHVDAPPPIQFRPEVDVRLQAICLKAISKKPSDRFGSMKDFAAALTEFARTAPSEARPSAPVVESGIDVVTDQFAGLLAAISSDVESKVERAVRKAGRNHRIPWWTYLVGSAVMGLVILWGILFVIKKDTVTVIVSIPIENINDPALSFILDKEPIAAEKFASPIELKPGEHELIVNKDGALYKRFLFNVGKADNDPVVVQDVTPKSEPAEPPPVEPVMEDDLARWQGTWQCVGGNIDNKVITEEHARRDGHIQIVHENSVTRVYGASLPSAFKIDPTKSPKHYDSDLATMAHPSGPFRHSGVYEFEGDRLKLIFRYRPVDKPIERATWEDRGKPGTVYLEYVRDLSKDGFVSLFNGKDLKGWTVESNDTENWKVQDGAITAIAEDAQPGKGAETWLLSDKEYQDFTLRFEFRAVSETVNSGFGYRAVPKEIPPVGNGAYSAPSHLQVELFENPTNRADRTLATGTLIGSLGPLLSIQANATSTQKPKGEWNRMEVDVRGQSVRIHLNGQELVDGSLDDLITRGATYPGLKRKSGRIAIQRLRGTIQFRDVEIKELQPAQDPLVGEWDWGWGETEPGEDPVYQNEITIHADGTCDSRIGSMAGKWERTENQIVISWANNAKDTLTISKYGTKLDGKNKEATRSVRARKKQNSGWIDLFNGKDLTGWHRQGGGSAHWKVQDGYTEVPVLVGEMLPGALVQRSIVTDRDLPLDFELHAEFWLPKEPDQKDQARGNSGIYLLGRHEIQICDSFENPIADLKHACGALYNEIPIMQNASLPPETWQAFDIRFQSPRADETGKITTGGRLTVVLNGKTVINDATVTSIGSRGGVNTDVGQVGPLLLQGHRAQVRFRNVRFRPIPSTLSATNSIPADAKTFGGHAYLFFSEQLTWHEARKRCEALGGHLVMIETPEENAFLSRLIADGGQQDSWIGATDESSEGQWRWVDGRNMTWTNWFKRQNQPNNKRGRGTFRIDVQPEAGRWIHRLGMVRPAERVSSSASAWICLRMGHCAGRKPLSQAAS